MCTFVNNRKTYRFVYKMQPPSKRPRLSIFERSPSDAELNGARHHNDMSLKSRFESIFAKYAHDFSGIGDEVDIITGDIIVNNGHLESIESEIDPGFSNIPGGFSSASRSMLRAMTVTLNPDLPGPDDVLMSIETIAENAALADGTQTSESEDDLFPASSVRSIFTTNDVVDTNIEPYNSDTDSLFDEQTAGYELLDHGFDATLPNNEDGTEDDTQSVNSPNQMPFTVDFSRENEGILQKYGPYMGKEVLNLLDQRRDAHIEPAWRIPVRLNETPLEHSVSRVSDTPSAGPDADLRGTKPSKLFWKEPRPTKATAAKQQPPIREESIDPLQEDISTENEHIAEPLLEDYDSDPDFTPESEDEISRDTVLQASAVGDCPYCESSFGSKLAVLIHWNRIIIEWEKCGMTDDQHDIAMMKDIRSMSMDKPRVPRLVVYDFRTLVELHEGAGMSFDEIEASKTLRTRRTSLQLQSIYNKYRTPSAWEGVHRQDDWTKQEKNALQEMCKNPLVTITTLRRRLKDRDELEIGNCLAEHWLSQLNNASREDTHEVNDEEITQTDTPALVSRRNRLPHAAESSQISIKQEESDDDLFG